MPSRFTPQSIASLALLALVTLAAACADSGKPGVPQPTPTTIEPGPMPPPAAPAPDVTPALRMPPPVTGGTLLVLSDGVTAVAADPDRDQVSVVDLVGNKLLQTVTFAAGDEPGRLVEESPRYVHVALRGAGKVVTVDVAKGRVIHTLPVCAAPRGLAFDKTRRLLHVACAGGELVSVVPDTGTVLRTLHLDRDLRDVMLRGDELLVTTFRKADLLVVSPDGQVQRMTPPPAVAAFSAGRGFGTPVDGPLTASGSGEAMASPAVAWRMVAGQNGEAMMLHQRGVDAVIGTQPSSYGGGQGCAGIVETAVSTMGPKDTEMRSSGALSNAVVAVDMAVSPDGRQVAVVSAGNAGTDQQVQFFEAADVSQPPNPKDPCLPGSTVPTMPPSANDPAPGPDMGPKPARPTTYLPPNGEVVAVAYDGVGNIIVQSRQPATLQILTQRAEPILLSPEVRADAGHQIFHSATSGKVACASCHPEGSEDGRTWQFAGEGMRRTQSLRGGIMDTAPFHWTGGLTNLDHLMRDVFQGRMSGPAVSRSQIQLLGRWLDTVRQVAPSAWHDSAAVKRGQTLFDSSAAGCNACHNGADRTNGTTVDVGTGGLFQVPQLRNLAFRAPYMHNGCAATLADRFGASCGGGDKHGVTSQLSAAEIDDLVAYLETL